MKVAFDGVGRTQRFAFQARRAPIKLPLWRFTGRRLSVSTRVPLTSYSDHRPELPAENGTSPLWPGNLSSHGKRVCWQGQTGRTTGPRKRTVIGTLLLSDMGLTNVTEETGMRRSALRIVLPGFVKAQLAVYRQAHVRGIGIFLAVVLPPTDRAEPHCVGGFQGLVSAAGAPILSCGSFHA